MDDRVPKVEFDLTGLNGSNPLAFLAALGSLAELSTAEHGVVRMAWRVADGAWRPRIQLPRRMMRDEVSRAIAEQIGAGKSRPVTDGTGEAALVAADKAHMTARKQLKDKLDEIKSRKLRGKERDLAIKAEATPLTVDVDMKRETWLRLLKLSSPSPELALGKDPGAVQDHFRLTASEIAASSSPAMRSSADLISAFGCDGIVDAKTTKARTTAFCFVTGSGWQYFLQNVRELLEQVDAVRIDRALFESHIPVDEKLSMRWDPLEDRRYAMMWSDPTSSGNAPKTNWALNLLAYRGLQLLPFVPVQGRGATTGFSVLDGDLAWTWPIWTEWLSPDVVRSLLALDELQQKAPDRVQLGHRGIVEVFRAARIQVGNPPLHKLNFAPAESV
jgi:hypothetical protein